MLTARTDYLLSQISDISTCAKQTRRYLNSCTLSGNPVDIQNVLDNLKWLEAISDSIRDDITRELADGS